MKKMLFIFILAISCVSGSARQEMLDPRFEQAYKAWDSGDYIQALQGFEAILKGQDPGRWTDRIALITGELYPVTELSTDGRSVRFSPSGNYAAYETGTRPTVTTHIVDVRRPGEIMVDIPGEGLVFAPDGASVAYLRVKETSEIANLRKELEDLSRQGTQDRQATMTRQRQLSSLEAGNMELLVRTLPTGPERTFQTGGLVTAGIAFSADGREVYCGGARESDTAASEIYSLSENAQPRALTSGSGFKTNPVAVPGGKYLLYTIASQSPFPRSTEAGGRGARGGGAPGGGGGGRGGGQGRREFAVFDIAGGKSTPFTGSAPAVADNGSGLIYLGDSGPERTIEYLKLAEPLAAVSIKKSEERIGSAAISPDGKRVTFEIPYTRNTEIFCINSDGTGEVRVSREIQPDWAPRFLTNSKVLAIKGERRHARSYLYDLDTLTSIKLFHNNTLRTIAPEYEWAASPDGSRVLIQAERDGDTISPERGVYLVDLNRKITRDELLARIETNLRTERALRAAGETMFRPIAGQVRAVTGEVSITKLYEYEEALFNFDSKYITQPGNKPAGEYIFRTLQSFGYQPEYQWFDARNVKTANILATLKGTENPELVYVLSSHYDSNQRGPGADDNSSAIAVLLETARIMATTPMPATIIFAAFTGEEAGLLGSREFVRQAVENKMQLAGALNNDMIGWTNDHRLDNTIRYSNAGIRDLQHAAAFLFSKMITYDARYFKSTDAAAYFDAYGDIVGGFGSYPVLGNPYYHQPTDLLETVNHQLLVEATKANTASIMLLAASPARIKDLKVDAARDETIDLSWAPALEKGVVSYTVAYGPAKDPMAKTVTVKEPRAHITGLKQGETWQFAVKAVNSRGLAGWDWARTSSPTSR